MSDQHPTILVGNIDHLTPVQRAMLQAKYSRDYGPIEDRLPKTEEDLASLEKRLETTYVGYGHKSVGQLGSTTTFVEGVSQLCAKAIEDDPLFNGQESSTRYIDFGPQPMINFGIKEIHDIQEAFRALYLQAVVEVKDRLKKEFPFDGSVKEVVWENTIKARTFDICRSLLPAGVTTNVAITETFDTMNDQFGAMLHHPSPEMKHVADTILTKLKETYPHATPGVDKLCNRFSYVTERHFYWHEGVLEGTIGHGSILKQPVGAGLGKFMLGRKKYEKFPKSFSCKYEFVLGGELDFGSFRDLQRHRNGTCLMPYLLPNRGLHPWYVSQLPEHIAASATAILEQFNKHLNIQVQDVENWLIQYAAPMGCLVPVSYKCDLNQLLYLFELRTDKTVHQTLRHYMQKAYREFASIQMLHSQDGIAVDLDEENFTLKRGLQTFNV